jgi:hypothetical protein
MDFFCILLNILKNSLVDIFVRCLSYRLIKIHRKFTSAYLLCDKASNRNEATARRIFCSKLWQPNIEESVHHGCQIKSKWNLTWYRIECFFSPDRIECLFQFSNKISFKLTMFWRRQTMNCDGVKWKSIKNWNTSITHFIFSDCWEIFLSKSDRIERFPASSESKMESRQIRLDSPADHSRWLIQQGQHHLNPVEHRRLKRPYHKEDKHL